MWPGFDSRTRRHMWVEFVVGSRPCSKGVFSGNDEALLHMRPCANYIRNKIDRQDVSPTCRLCGEREETVSHITTECKKLAQNQFKNWKHDKVAQAVNWNLCKKFKPQCSETWYDHSTEAVVENDQVKLLWNFRIQTDRHLDRNRPNIVVLEKGERVCFFIDVACPFETRIEEKEREKIDPYQDLKVEVQKIWNCRSVSVIPIVMGALGAVSKHLKIWVSKIGTPGIFTLLQKACLFGKAKIFRRTLDT